ncbi:hypothetical protein PR002_g7705 [Phytophthora rubi]|uniref:HotDog ACOT-type domain-containing protein n=1 Tax=Phytophthora rubi TaxID=129364 RepID=A0A6A3MQD4_9STRA|nr:hypothetical protein PR002_g7705 [Phytophthora rubi]
MSTARQSSVTVQQTRLAYADTFGDEHLRGKLMGLGPILHHLDNFGGAVAENAISKKVAMAALENLEVVNPIFHEDVVRFEGELINIGRSSLTLQVIIAIPGTQDVALDDDNRPYRGLPELVDPTNGSRIRHLQDVAQQRKDLSMRLKRIEESVDNLPAVSLDMLDNTGEWSEQVPVQDTVVALAASFLPRHLNRNGTVFGGEILSWMDKTALYCGRVFTGNSNMVTVSANRVSFNMPVTTDDVTTVVARVCGIREHCVDVEVEVFLRKFASQEHQKSHTGYFYVANFNTAAHVSCVTRGLRVDHGDQENVRTLLKAQHRRGIRQEEKQLLHLEPLELSAISRSHL